MAVDCYLSEIQIFAFPFAPKNWAQCNGQTLAISTNQALFSLLGTSFGGNGVTTFNLPDLRSRTSIGMGNAPAGGNYTIGEVGGEEFHSLTIAEMPAHNHQMNGTSATADAPNPDGNLVATGAASAMYIGTQNSSIMAGTSIATTGNGQGHPNIQPYLALNYCISLAGVYPSRN